MNTMSPHRLSLFVNPKAGQPDAPSFIGNLSFYEPSTTRLLEILQGLEPDRRDRRILPLEGKKCVSQKTGAAYLGLNLLEEPISNAYPVPKSSPGNFYFMSEGEDENGLTLFKGFMAFDGERLEEFFSKLDMQEKDSYNRVSVFATALRYREGGKGAEGEFSFPRLTVPRTDDTGL